MPDVRADEVRLTGVAEYESRLRRLADATKATGQAMNESAATAQQAMDGLSESADKYTAALERANRQAEQGFRQASTVGARIGPEAEARMRATVAPPVEPTVTAPGMDAAEMHRRETARNIQDYQAARDSAAEREQRAEQEAARRDFWAAKGFTGDAEIARMERRAGEARARLSADTAEAARMRAAGQALAGTAPRPLAGIAEAESVARAAAAQQRMADVQKQVAATGRAAGASVGELSDAYQKLYGTGTYAEGGLGRVNAALARGQSAARSYREEWNPLLGTLRGVGTYAIAAAAAIAGVATYATRQSMIWSSAEATVRGMTGSTTMAADAIGAVERVARELKVPIIDLVGALPELSAAAQGAGVDMETALTTVAELAGGLQIPVSTAAAAVASIMSGTARDLPAPIRAALQRSGLDFRDWEARGIRSIDGLRDAMKASGIPEAAAAAAAEIGGSWTDMTNEMLVAWRELGDSLVPILRPGIEGAAALFRWLNAQIEKHPTATGVGVAAAGIAAGATAAGAGILYGAVKLKGLAQQGAAMFPRAAAGVGRGAGMARAAAGPVGAAISAGAAAYDVSMGLLEPERGTPSWLKYSAPGIAYKEAQWLSQRLGIPEWAHRGGGPVRVSVPGAIGAEESEIIRGRPAAAARVTGDVAGAEEHLRVLRDEIQLMEAYGAKQDQLLPKLRDQQNAQKALAKTYQDKANFQKQIGQATAGEIAETRGRGAAAMQAARMTETVIVGLQRKAAEEKKALEADWFDWRHDRGMVSTQQYLERLRAEAEAAKAGSRERLSAEQRYYLAVDAMRAEDIAKAEEKRRADVEAITAPISRLEATRGALEAQRAALEGMGGDVAGVVKQLEALDAALANVRGAAAPRLLAMGDVEGAYGAAAEAWSAYGRVKGAPAARARESIGKLAEFVPPSLRRELTAAERAREQDPQKYVAVQQKIIEAGREALRGIEQQEPALAAVGDLVEGHSEEWHAVTRAIDEATAAVAAFQQSLQPEALGLSDVLDSLRELADLRPERWGPQYQQALEARGQELAPEIAGVLTRGPQNRQELADLHEAIAIQREMDRLREAPRPVGARASFPTGAAVPALAAPPEFATGRPFSPAGDVGDIRAEWAAGRRLEQPELTALTIGAPSGLSKILPTEAELARADMTAGGRDAAARFDRRRQRAELQGGRAMRPGLRDLMLTGAQQHFSANMDRLRAGAAPPLAPYMGALGEPRGPQPQVEVKVFIGERGPWTEYTDAKVETTMRDHAEDAARANWVGGFE